MIPRGLNFGTSGNTSEWNLICSAASQTKLCSGKTRWRRKSEVITLWIWGISAGKKDEQTRKPKRLIALTRNHLSFYRKCSHCEWNMTREVSIVGMLSRCFWLLSFQLISSRRICFGKKISIGLKKVKLPTSHVAIEASNLNDRKEFH